MVYLRDFRANIGNEKWLCAQNNECAFWTTLVSHMSDWLPLAVARTMRGRSPRLIFQVVGQSRDDVLTAVRRREAIIPARIWDCSFLLQVVP
jgi:hypothetical protein